MADTTSGAGPIQIDVDLVKQLADILDAAKLNEIEVEDSGRRIRVMRQPSFGGYVGNELPAYAAPSPQLAGTPSPPATASNPVAAPDPSATPGAEHPGTIRSPMVGTAYLSAAASSAAKTPARAASPARRRSPPPATRSRPAIPC